MASNDGLECLAGCRAIEHLGLSYTHVTDDGLTVLTRLTALKHITLDSQLVRTGVNNHEWMQCLWQVTEHGVERLARCLPWVVSLELFGTKVTDSSCLHLRCEYCVAVITNVFADISCPGPSVSCAPWKSAAAC